MNLGGGVGDDGDGDGDDEELLELEELVGELRTLRFFVPFYLCIWYIYFFAYFFFVLRPVFLCVFIRPIILSTTNF